MLVVSVAQERKLRQLLGDLLAAVRSVALEGSGFGPAAASPIGRHATSSTDARPHRRTCEFPDDRLRGRDHQRTGTVRTVAERQQLQRIRGQRHGIGVRTGRSTPDAQSAEHRLHEQLHRRGRRNRPSSDQLYGLKTAVLVRRPAVGGVFRFQLDRWLPL